MAKANLYSIYDQTAEAFCNPFVVLNDSQACRAMEASLEDPNSSIARYPMDYSLHHIAEFDNITGVVTPVDQKRVTNGLELMQQMKTRKDQLDTFLPVNGEK